MRQSMDEVAADESFAQEGEGKKFVMLRPSFDLNSSSWYLPTNKKLQKEEEEVSDSP
jgi:hypothetical protein